ncbi:hypothetical protein ACFHWS_01695 [Micromonospora sp. LOL_013]|uniref:hypothetical protein n=1 Tax=Micromonospora sp. LOL_013 TaxID=3345414 RepID=UPI003A8BE6DD
MEQQPPLRHHGTVVMVAGTVDLTELMAALRNDRPVFHSEADFQHGFAWALHRLDASVNVRLEVPQDNGERLDVLAFADQGWTAIELKYFTAPWSGTSPEGEVFKLRDHAASDLARLGFINDICRLEKLCRRHGHPATGLAVMLTNSRSLWSEPARRPTRDAQFRIHAGRTVTGTLRGAPIPTSTFRTNEPWPAPIRWSGTTTPRRPARTASSDGSPPVWIAASGESAA